MWRTFVLCSGAVALLGCGPILIDTSWPSVPGLAPEAGDGRSPMAHGGRGALPEADEPRGRLTLEQALGLALAHNPELAAASWKVRAADARTMQAGLRPNPELEFEAEEFGGTGGLSGTGALANTLVLSQEIELGGKRAKRAKVASSERKLSAWGYEAKRLDVVTKATLAFIHVLAAQERLALAEEAVRLAERTVDVVADRVEAGKVSPLEGLQAEVALSTRRLALTRAGNERQAAHEALAATWGSSPPKFEGADGELSQIEPLPPVEPLIERVAESPGVLRYRDETTAAHARLELEQATAKPNLSVGGGIQRFEESGDSAFTVSVSIPLPLFDRNQGGILEAERELERIREERRAAEVRVRTALRKAYGELATARQSAVSLREKVLPAARRTYEAASEGYRQGKFGFIQVLDAQRTLVQVRGQRIQALEAYHKAIAELERLIGTDLESVVRSRERPGEGTRPHSDQSDPGAQPIP